MSHETDPEKQATIKRLQDAFAAVATRLRRDAARAWTSAQQAPSPRERDVHCEYARLLQKQAAAADIAAVGALKPPPSPAEVAAAAGAASNG